MHLRYRWRLGELGRRGGRGASRERTAACHAAASEGVAAAFGFGWHATQAQAHLHRGCRRHFLNCFRIAREATPSTVHRQDGVAPLLVVPLLLRHVRWLLLRRHHTRFRRSLLLR
jgi:hypothetical protein